ncbi:MAG: M23 family metallopeptidase [Myxococcota bacterium]|nr:M23 family metallopeptidase [Myxococcota bacterium]
MRQFTWWCLAIVAALTAPLLTPDGATAQELDRLGRVVLAERVPERWLSDDSDRFPLQPARQRRRMPRRCRTRGGYRQHCQGQRLIPTPFGAAAALASHLGLGVRATAMQVMHQRPFDEWLIAVRDLDAEERLTFPVPTGHTGRGFGYTRDDGLRHRRHDGVDIGAGEGAAIVAARGGLVVYSDNGITGMGNTVILLHQDGASTLYAHCRANHVFAGQYVTRGELIAEVGETGFANAPHLHFEWRQRGWVRDPGRRFIPRDHDPALHQGT